MRDAVSYAPHRVSAAGDPSDRGEGRVDEKRDARPHTGGDQVVHQRTPVMVAEGICRGGRHGTRHGLGRPPLRPSVFRKGSGSILSHHTRREAPIALPTALPERDWSIGLIVLAHQPSTHHKTNRHGQGSGRNGPDRSSAMSPAIIFVLAFLVCTTAAKSALLSKPALPLASSVFDDTVYGWEEVAQSAASVAAPPLEAWLDSNNVTLYGVRIARFSHGLYSDVQLRGVVATEQVSTGDVLASVPSVRRYGLPIRSTLRRGWSVNPYTWPAGPAHAYHHSHTTHTLTRSSHTCIGLQARLRSHQYVAHTV